MRVSIQFGIFLLLFTAGICRGQTNAMAGLSLSRSFALAEERSETLQIGAAEWRAAEARYRQVAGGRWPEAHLLGAATLRDGGGSRNAHDIRAGAGATWTVFNGFRTLREAEALQAEGRAIQFDTARARQLLYQDVADVFYQVLGYEGELFALQNKLGALGDRAAKLEQRVQLGKSRKAELLSAQTQLARATIGEEELKGLRAAAQELLAFLTGLQPGACRPVDTTPLPEAKALEHFLGSTGFRPDIQAAGVRVESASKNLEAAEAEKKPEVNAGANVYAFRDPGDQGQWDVSLSVELPVFDKGLRRARVAERMESVQVSELRLSQVRRMSQFDVRSAYQQLMSAWAQWVALDHALAVSAEDHALQQADYEKGRAANLDVLDALVQLHELRQQRAALEMRLRASLIHLHVAAGAETP